MILSDISVEELVSLLAKELKPLLTNTVPAIAKSDTDEMLSIDDTAKYLKLSKSTIYTLVSKSELPSMKKVRGFTFLRMS